MSHCVFAALVHHKKVFKYITRFITIFEETEVLFLAVVDKRTI